MADQPNGWHEWSKHILKELIRLNDCYERLDIRMNKLSTTIAVLKVKSGLWGALAGLVPGLIVAFILWLKYSGD